MKRTGILRRTVLRKSNPKRKARLLAEQYGGGYADWIRSLPCLIRGNCWGRIEAAHVRSRGAGGKARDLVPLCQGHHHDQHVLGVRTFEERHGFELKKRAAELWEQWNRKDGG